MTALQFLTEWALRSSILILSGTLLLWALRVKDPSIRLAAWTVMLCGSLLIPALAAALPRVPLVVMRVPSRPVEVPAVVNDGRPVSAPVEFSQDDGSAQHVPAVPRRFDWIRAGLITTVTIYVLVAGALLLRLCAGLMMSFRLLRRSRAIGQATQGIEIRESDGVASPVALGMARPAIVLPVDWREWDAAKLDAVLAHERSHIRRQDPAVQLLSAIHRALLWHSPLSWFLHRRIVRVAEEASDDAAVEATRDRASYAETLLDFMQRGVRSASWQGVPMARYSRPEARIHRILDSTMLSRGVTRWSIAAILILAAPLAYVAAAVHPQSAAQAVSVAPGPDGTPTTEQAHLVPEVAAQTAPVQAAPARATAPQQSTAAPPSTEKRPTLDAVSAKPTAPPDLHADDRVQFEVASVKQIRECTYETSLNPARVVLSVPLNPVIMTAFQVSKDQIIGPSWLESDCFEVVAKLPQGSKTDQIPAMLRALLAERFKLSAHKESRPSTVYALVVDNKGPKLKEAAEDSTFMGKAPRNTMAIARGGRGGIKGIMTMEFLAKTLSRQGYGQIVDATELKGEYEISLSWVPDPGIGQAAPSAAMDPGADLFAALRESLGLRLEPRKTQTEVLVIDHIERVPTGN
jgi:uncharacterized protein (TIGR03435 family)